MLFFTQRDNSGSLQSAVTQVLIGNSYSTPPNYEARYIFAEVGTSTKLLVNVQVSTQMAGGQVNRMPLSDNSTTFNQFQAQLERVKAEIEGRKPAQ